MKNTINQPGLLILVLLLFTTSFTVSLTHAGEMTITLDDVSVGTCEEIWYEIGLPLWFTGTPGYDILPTSCVFDADANDSGLQGVHLGPAHLVVDVGELEGLDHIHMDITIVSGSTYARMYREGERVYTHGLSEPGDQLFYLPCLGGDTFVISSDNSFVWEIRLSGDNLVPNEAFSFGSVKSIFR